MADKEITLLIDKLRKTRPARALETIEDCAVPDRDTLVLVLGMLRDDLKEEARLVEQQKIKGGLSIIKDRLAVAGWLELFVSQLGREDAAPVAPTERLSPSPELGEHRPSEHGTDAASLPGPGERCAVGNVHDKHTLKCPCGYSVDTSRIDLIAVRDYLSGASDTLPYRAGDPLANREPWDPDGLTDSLTGVEFQLGTPDVGDQDAAAHEVADAIVAEVLGDPAGAPAGILAALDIDPQEQATHDAIDRELAHVTADPIGFDPFAPIPKPVYAPTAPPGAVKWTTADLLVPVDPASLPGHVSFSQLTTVSDCGAKYRMQRLAGLPQVPQWANVGGKAFHACVELMEQDRAPDGTEGVWVSMFEGQIVDAERESGMTRQQFRASQQGKENYDWWRVEGAIMLRRYVDWRQGAGAAETLMVLPLPGGGNRPALEWDLTYDVDGIPFNAILDSVWIDRSGAEPIAVIRDWKTGSTSPDDRQLCTQAWALRKAGCPWEVRVQFFDARKGAFSDAFDPFERMTWDDVRYFVLSGDAARRMSILPARPSDWCGGCSVAYACPIMAQRKTPKVAR